jgi:hypothetical protein
MNQPTPYGQIPPPPGYSPEFYGAPRTNPLAVAALAVSLVSIAGCLPVGLVGAIMGHVARGQVRQRGEDGAGMALAAVVIGWISVAATLAVAAAIFAPLLGFAGGSGY